MTGEEHVTVVVVDDHALFRAGVRAELGRRVAVVGEAGSVAVGIELVPSAPPEVVLLDVHMPDGGGVAVIAAAAPQRPSAVPRAVGLRRGRGRDRHDPGRARGYVTKTIAADELADAIGAVAAGDAVLLARLAGFVLDAFAAPAPSATDPELDQLTPREREVLRHIARGYTYKEIAPANSASR